MARAEQKSDYLTRNSLKDRRTEPLRKVARDKAPKVGYGYLTRNAGKSSAHGRGQKTESKRNLAARELNSFHFHTIPIQFRR